jgi:DNA-binding CsgD family transcriptional regulator
VRAHLGNIFRKVGVKGKAGLILEFIEKMQRAGI